MKGSGRDGFQAAFALALLPVFAGCLLLASKRPVHPSHPLELAALAVATLGCFLALSMAPRVEDSPALVAVLISGALALRLVWLGGEPALSDDLERYVWEGGLVVEGVDPYSHAPADPELAEFQARWWTTFERVNHPEVSAAYPPLSQAVNAAAVALAGGPERAGRARAFLRGAYALCDLGVLMALLALLRRRKAPLALAVAWAWNPLVALEFAGAGHLDALGILFLVLALLCSVPGPRGQRRERAGRWAVAWLVAGAAAKLLPAVLLPFALRRLARVRGGLLVALVSTGLVLVPLVLLAGALPGTAGLGEYALRWESFNLVFRWVEPLFAGPRDGSWQDPRRLARALVFALWLGVALHAWRRRLELARAAELLVGGFLLLTPTLHPWYLAWMVPFLALRSSAAWAWLVAAAPLLYWPVERWRAERVWEEPPWSWPAVAGPFLVLLALERWRATRGRR